MTVHATLFQEWGWRTAPANGIEPATAPVGISTCWRRDGYRFAPPILRAWFKFRL